MDWVAFSPDIRRRVRDGGDRAGFEGCEMRRSGRDEMGICQFDPPLNRTEGNRRYSNWVVRGKLDYAIDIAWTVSLGGKFG